ncbi:DMT family transporter [Candidatus Pacearchaeota archaeon]|nr:DMT family transporter [Candidatus Pacearchaeota archaeon]
MFYIPIIGAILEASGMTIEKIMLKTKSLNYKNYTVFGFLAIVLVMLPFVFFFWRIDPEAYSLKSLIILLIVIASAIAANLLTYYALKRESLSVIEPIRLMQPLLTIILAVILYSSERTNPLIILLAIIASITLICSHIKKSHLVYDKYILAALGGSLFFAIELVISKSILPYYNSFTFYFIRCLIIFLVTLVIFKPEDKFNKKIKLTMLLTGTIWIIYRIILYYGYESYGIVFTTILFILTPIFVYIFAALFLKEKLTLRQIISSIVILACVVAAIIIQSQ